MHALVRTILLPHEDGDNPARVIIGGPDIAIAGDVVTSLALLLHELTTNAAKYGALSSPGGCIDIACGEDGSRFVLRWSESGGPTVDHPPEMEGFGSLLVRSTLERQLNGTITREWRPEGLLIQLAVERDRLTGGQ